MTDQCEHEWHIDGRDVFIQCWHSVEHSLTVPEAEAMLSAYEARGQRIADQANEIDEWRNAFHLAEVKVMSREAIIEQLSETELAKDVTRLEEENTLLAEHNRALQINLAESLEDIVGLVEKAMRCIEATGEGFYTEMFDKELTDAFNTLDDALSTLKPQLVLLKEQEDDPD